MSEDVDVTPVMVQKIVTVKTVAMTVHAKINITPLLPQSMDIDRTTKALNLWDIEMQIKQLHKHLDALHEIRDDLLQETDEAEQILS